MSVILDHKYTIGKWVLPALISSAISNIGEIEFQFSRLINKRETLNIGMLLVSLLTIILIIVKFDIIKIPKITSVLIKRIGFKTIFYTIISVLTTLLYTFGLNKLKL